jgi:predicted Zn-dependent protease
VTPLQRSRRPAAWAATALALALAASVAIGARAGRAQDLPKPVDASLGVCLVPIGPVPPAVVADLVAHLRAKLGLAITVLPPIAAEHAALDRDRVQVIAEELGGSLRGLPQHARNVLIGLTTYDMYIRAIPSWEWAFAHRDGERVIVISTARMDEANWGRPSAPERLRARLRKMVAKNLGLVYYGLRQTSDRRSVLFGPILSLEDLDSIGEDFRP